MTWPSPRVFHTKVALAGHGPIEIAHRALPDTYTPDTYTPDTYTPDTYVSYSMADIDQRIAQANPRIYCALRGDAILGFAVQTDDPGFTQQNPQMVQIRTLRLKYVETKVHD